MEIGFKGFVNPTCKLNEIIKRYDYCENYFYDSITVELRPQWSWRFMMLGLVNYFISRKVFIKRYGPVYVHWTFNGLLDSYPNLIELANENNEILVVSYGLW